MIPAHVQAEAVIKVVGFRYWDLIQYAKGSVCAG